MKACRTPAATSCRSALPRIFFTLSKATKAAAAAYSLSLSRLTHTSCTSNIVNHKTVFTTTAAQLDLHNSGHRYWGFRHSQRRLFLKKAHNDIPQVTSTQTLPSDYPHLSSVLPALSAVRKACRITSQLQPERVDNDISGITKADASPVTIGDFAAQAIVLHLLQKTFPNHIMIAEEGSDALVEDQNLSTEILQVLKQCGYDSIIGTDEELKRSIDLGKTYASDGSIVSNTIPNGSHYRWTLDPIDGTRGFLRGKRDGGQYCVALALIDDRSGAPIAGILGCPNLPSSATDDLTWTDEESAESNVESRGCIFIASKGGGTYQLPLYPPSTPEGKTDDGEYDHDSCTEGATKVHVTDIDTRVLKTARFCTGVESYGDPLGQCSTIAQSLHGSLDSDGDIMYTRKLDSQVKYGILARGEAEIFLRLPKKSYVEWIWDHAAGRIIIEEAGGIQTDTNGDLIDYGLGAKMDPNVNGILVSCGGTFHEALLKAYKSLEDD